jgi:hypothetical protein
LPYLGFLKEFYAQNSDFVLQAANTSFSRPFDKQFTTNGMSTLELARMASAFINLRQFVQSPPAVAIQINQMASWKRKYTLSATWRKNLGKSRPPGHFCMPPTSLGHTDTRSTSQSVSSQLDIPSFPSLSSTKPALAQVCLSPSYSMDP